MHPILYTLLGPIKEEEEREEFHYNAANRMIASATPIHTTEVGHVIVM